MTTPDVFFHITEPDLWKAATAAGEYTQSTRGRSLVEVGYLHGSFASQVTMVANAVYADWPDDLLLLKIDPARVPADIRVENLEGGEVAFPHIYGPLRCDAVVSIHHLVRSDEGWALPSDL